VLVIPGLNGDPGLLLAAAPRLFPGMRPLAFAHRLDLAERGVEGLTEQALAVLDADPDGDAPAYVCGESFGGTVALTLAHRHPERVRGLLLLSTFGRYPALPAYGGAAGLALWRMLGARAGGQAFRAGRLFAVPGQLGFRFPREVARAYLSLPAAHPPAYRAKCELALRFDARPWLGSITCPTLVLIGSWDPVVPPSAGRELARLLPNARLHRLTGGHLVHLVHAAEAGQLIASWAAERAGQAPGLAAPPDRARPAPCAPG
jgi:pimeloyl-ACP methyl ester carboxylesterase